MTIYLIVFVGLSWLLQSMLGLGQVRNFNRRYAELRSMGRVAIGKRTGKFRAGTLVMFVINRDNVILKAVKMQGVTVFSRVRDMKGFEGKILPELSESDLTQVNALTRIAIKDALSNFDIITKGGELQIKKTWLEKLIPAKK
ncbi:transcriptional regulator GutM [Paenibacillus wynnii]|uniref:Glucitol operon activator n=1 Tax=Paenibacillus wynnii TaxID=268407 RepID=A0A098MAG6_9BACL|nr:transcriptional regulator GutM [Paenibacillus wynnii]KGE19051.1 glucitol operon activator [Paenibacillus wynnii]